MTTEGLGSSWRFPGILETPLFRPLTSPDRGMVRLCPAGGGGALVAGELWTPPCDRGRQALLATLPGATTQIPRRRHHRATTSVAGLALFLTWLWNDKCLALFKVHRWATSFCLISCTWKPIHPVYWLQPALDPCHTWARSHCAASCRWGATGPTSGSGTALDTVCLITSPTILALSPVFTLSSVSAIVCFLFLLRLQVLLGHHILHWQRFLLLLRFLFLLQFLVLLKLLLVPDPAFILASVLWTLILFTQSITQIAATNGRKGKTTPKHTWHVDSLTPRQGTEVRQSC